MQPHGSHPAIQPNFLQADRAFSRCRSCSLRQDTGWGTRTPAQKDSAMSNRYPLDFWSQYGSPPRREEDYALARRAKAISLSREELPVGMPKTSESLVRETRDSLVRSHKASRCL